MAVRREARILPDVARIVTCQAMEILTAYILGIMVHQATDIVTAYVCLLYTSPSPRDS